MSYFLASEYLHFVAVVLAGTANAPYNYFPALFSPNSTRSELAGSCYHGNRF